MVAISVACDAGGLQGCRVEKKIAVRDLFLVSSSPRSSFLISCPSYAFVVSKRQGVGLDPRQNRPETKQSFYASIGSLALPHPHKMPNGSVSASTREHRHLEFAEDPTLSEDAHFVLDISWPTATTDTVHYVGIADGVGSWRRVGVDPREFR